MYGAFGALAAVLVGDLSVADEAAEGLVVDVVAADVLRAVVDAQGHGDLCGFEFDAHRAVFG